MYTKPGFENVFWHGYNDMQEKIQAMGFDACRDEFNLIYKPGVPYTGSESGYWYMRGEHEALMNA